MIIIVKVTVLLVTHKDIVVTCYICLVPWVSVVVWLSDMVCGELKLARLDLSVDFDSANLIWTELCATWTFLVPFLLYKCVYY